MQKFVSSFCLILALTITWSSPTPSRAEKSPSSEKIWVYFAGEGIHLYRFDLQSGALEPLSKTQDAKPSFLAIHPNGRFLYGVGRGLSAFSIDQTTGELSFLSAIPYPKQGLCHLTVDKTGSNVLCAGYGAGTVLVHRIDEEGRLGEQSALVEHQGSSISESRQKEPHAHSVNLDAENNFAFAADLGTDDIFIYRFDAAAGILEPNDPPSISMKPGAGPRHFSFHPSGRFAYVINELDSTVGAYRYDPTAGRLEEIETQTTLPDDFTETNYTAEVVVHPSGRFLYGSNRGHNSLAVFAIDPTTGKLTFVEHTSTGGNWPRNFCIDPTGRFLLAANQKSDNIRVFRIDLHSGKLQSTSHVAEVPKPNCIRFLRPMAW